MNSGHLKLLACITMVIDHLTYCFIPQYLEGGGESVLYYIGRGLGRSSFIIICFLLVEGFFNTKNIRKYLLRMLVFAIISEVPYDLMSGNLNSTGFLKNQNVLFLFLLGLSMMYILNQLNEIYYREQNRKSLENRTYFNSPYLKYNILSTLVCVLGFLSAYLLRIDYGFFGLILIMIFYFLRYRNGMLVAAVICWGIAGLFMNHMLEWAGLIALIPIIKLYNGEKGKLSKWFFYIFFPGHMLLLGIIKMVLL